MTFRAVAIENKAYYSFLNFDRLVRGAKMSSQSQHKVVVFESPVQSGLLPPSGWTKTKTGLCKLKC